MPDGKLLCKKCDVYVGFAAEGVVRRPKDRDDAWLVFHCWVCGRSASEIVCEQNPLAVDPLGRISEPGERGRDVFDPPPAGPAVRVTVTTPDGEPLGDWVTYEDGRHEWKVGPAGSGADFECDGSNDEVEINKAVAAASEPGSKSHFAGDRKVDSARRSAMEPSQEISKYVDKAMFDAEPERALDRPRVHLLSATPDPLGAVAAFAMMYEGRVIRDLTEITDEERRYYFDECFKTALKTPLEAIDLHFMVEGLTRASWDQMRTQRTAVFAGESLRFAVKPDLQHAVRPGPLVSQLATNREAWKKAINAVNDAYHALIGNGVPAEDARGLLPMNILTRGHWKTNLRNLESEVGKRLCTQAQFEWRLIHADLRRSIRKYKSPVHSCIPERQSWQWEYIASSPMFVPICFQKGACMFKSGADRGCTIRERVDRGAFSEIRPEEWMADPTAAWVR